MHLPCQYMCSTCIYMYYTCKLWWGQSSQWSTHPQPDVKLCVLVLLCSYPVIAMSWRPSSFSWRASTWCCWGSPRSPVWVSGLTGWAGVVCVVIPYRVPFFSWALWISRFTYQPWKYLLTLIRLPTALPSMHIHIRKHGKQSGLHDPLWTVASSLI